MPRPAKTPGDTRWFIHDRFGMFIHWGLYALPARHEWVKMREEISDADYDRYFRRFDPDLYNPREWAAAAADAGMRYFVVTSKHHDGFCLWDSDLTDYKVTNTPYGRDLLEPMVEAFRDDAWHTLFATDTLRWGPGAQRPLIDVDMRGAQRLRLSVDGGPTIHADHAAWADAKLE